MIAHHPITGKEIRIIQTSASLWKERKTLSYTSGSIWDTANTSFNATYRIFLEPVLKDDLICKSKILFFARTHLDLKLLDELSIKNALCLDELHILYPHIGSPWDGSLADAVMMIASLMRYQYVHGIWGSRGELLGLSREINEPAPLWWITQYYKPTQSKRRKELQKCLEVNTNSNLISKIILLNEVSEGNFGGKVEERVIGKRLTYADVFKTILDIPDDVIVAFANADICIDDISWRNLWSVNMANKFLAILRYDVGEDGGSKIFGPRADSQDTWVVRAIDIKSFVQKQFDAIDFNFGRMGCDNALALEMLKNKFIVINPAYSIKTYHHHVSKYRTYSPDDVIEKPVFHYIEPSGLHELMPNVSIPTKIQPATLIYNICGPESASWVYKMKDSGKWNLGTFEVAPVAEAIINLKNVFQTPDGLVYDSKQMYIGSAKRAQTVWGESVMHAMMPTLECKRVVAVPYLHTSCRATYIIRYLSKVLRFLTGSEEFICPENMKGLEIFNWKRTVPLIKYDPEIVIWCEEAVVHPVSDNVVVLKEDVDALRKMVNWKETPCETGGRLRIVIMEDGFDATELEDILDRAWDLHIVYPTTSAERMQDVLSGAWGIVCGSGIQSTGWNWLLPFGAKVFEIVQKGCSSGIEISAASGLEHRFVSNSVDSICKEIWMQTKEVNLFDTPLQSSPIIWIPRRSLEGYFSHPGDSFREMLRLWNRNGYVQVREHPTAMNIWWGEVGVKGVLLYDRPTHEWRLASPLVEREWAFALFGNPKPVNGSPWTFWPRRPELVEEMHSVRLPWSKRSGKVFYGKTENKVQEKRRKGDWESICTEWIVVTDPKAPQALSQKEYLERLGKARYGLCLPGYGFKCHREIECLAMGCVPIITPNVDVESYAEPLIAGVHYVYAENPLEAAKIQLSEEDWIKISDAGYNWWKRNASCAGSFELTKKLIQESS